MPRSTKRDFNLFKSEFNYWVVEFGMKGWNYVFHHLETEDTWLTSVHIQQQDRIATVMMNKNFDDDLTDYSICLCAFYEALKVLMAGLQIMSQPNNIGEESHIVIQTLINSFYESSFKKRYK